MGDEALGQMIHVGVVLVFEVEQPNDEMRLLVLTSR
jgi:hypothetical protein